LQVDLTGQVCADSIGTRLFSGVGADGFHREELSLWAREHNYQ
jgi:hypothetical protein